MDTEQTANQLELAAKIIRTGHPWEYRCPHSIPEWKKEHRAKVDPIYRVASKWEIRLVLATPPDNRPLHNPSNLTAEQVGAGWRLTLENEWNPLQEYWHSTEQWKKSTHLSELDTFRLPLSTPWPEAEKPKSAFTLPTPPPGTKWHRLDGWQEGDLPQGYRPHVSNEHDFENDESRDFNGIWVKLKDCKYGTSEIDNHRRTTRPLVFTHAGKEWTWHKLGDPMPQTGTRLIETLFDDGSGGIHPATYWSWHAGDCNPIGWRYADKPEPREVDLGPEDVIKKMRGFLDSLEGCVTGSK